MLFKLFQINRTNGYISPSETALLKQLCPNILVLLVKTVFQGEGGIEYAEKLTGKRRGGQANADIG